ncbi:hypothetical protein ADK67_16595 [Saccharothrix sp. NRRL B-16348]|nr:hypothetical protein ADK67_16595 [Saccharothrix sp. NRRL B-16348]
MECEPIAEPPVPDRSAPTLPVPTGWWPEPDTIGWVRRSADPESDPESEADDPDGLDDSDGPAGDDPPAGAGG